ncbi:MAG TPA: alpha/beta hydrolase [Jatrophihabitantaceae bacterium]|jgi:pimeloyl-ACP methyl ester carboxylesterase
MAAPTPITLSANGYEFTGFSIGAPEGRPVLLLHGFPQTSGSWLEVAGRLAAEGLRAVAVDQRGYSPGARPSDVAAYALPELISDVCAIIDALGGSVDLVGHDWGAVVGWQVAARHPERVRTWTAVSTPNQLALNEVLAVDDEQRQRFGYILAFREPGRAETALLADDAQRLRQLYGGAVSAERVEADVAAFSQPGALTAALNWYRAMSPHDADGLGLVTVPTTYLWGTEDIAFGRLAAEGSARYVDADYTFVPLDGVGHWVPDQAPDAVVAEILTLIQIT